MIYSNKQIKALVADLNHYAVQPGFITSRTIERAAEIIQQLRRERDGFQVGYTELVDLRANLARADAEIADLKAKLALTQR